MENTIHKQREQTIRIGRHTIQNKKKYKKMQNYIKLHKKADAAEIKIRVRKKCQIREKVEVD